MQCTYQALCIFPSIDNKVKCNKMTVTNRIHNSCVHYFHI
jgi:hypothetical protein